MCCSVIETGSDAYPTWEKNLQLLSKRYLFVPGPFFLLFLLLLFSRLVPLLGLRRRRGGWIDPTHLPAPGPLPLVTLGGRERRNDDPWKIVLTLGLGQVLPPHLNDHVDQDDGEQRQQAEHEPGPKEGVI